MFLMVTTAGRDLPYRFHDAMADGHELIPAVHHDILLAAVQQELVAHLEWCESLAAQDDMIGVQRLDGTPGMPSTSGKTPPGPAKARIPTSPMATPGRGVLMIVPRIFAAM